MHIPILTIAHKERIEAEREREGGGRENGKKRHRKKRRIGMASSRSAYVYNFELNGNNNIDKYKSNTNTSRKIKSKFLKFDTKRRQLLMQNEQDTYQATTKKNPNTRSLAKMPERARSKRSSLQKQIKKKNGCEETKKKRAHSTLYATARTEKSISERIAIVNLRMK